MLGGNRINVTGPRRLGGDRDSGLLRMPAGCFVGATGRRALFALTVGRAAGTAGAGTRCARRRSAFPVAAGGLARRIAGGGAVGVCAARRVPVARRDAVPAGAFAVWMRCRAARRRARAVAVGLATLAMGCAVAVAVAVGLAATAMGCPVAVGFCALAVGRGAAVSFAALAFGFFAVSAAEAVAMSFGALSRTCAAALHWRALAVTGAGGAGGSGRPRGAIGGRPLPRLLGVPRTASPQGHCRVGAGVARGESVQAGCIGRKAATPMSSLATSALTPVPASSAVVPATDAPTVAPPMHVPAPGALPAAASSTRRLSASVGASGSRMPSCPR